MTYQDFDLLVERAGEDVRARVLGSGDPAEVLFRLPFSELQLENVLLRLGGRRRVVRRIESSEMLAAKTFGGSLFEVLFTGPVGAAFERRLDEARREDRGLRIRLRVTDPALADLPWEYLYDPRGNRFLALSIHTPLVRYIDLPDPIEPIAVAPPIRVLVMISSPADLPALDAGREWKTLLGSLDDLLARGQIAIERADRASLSSLQQRLRRDKYHILHFIGHGQFDAGADEGVLVLEDENGRGHRVGSQHLGMLLHDHDSLRVAVLNACEGARSSRVDPFAGSAQTLVQQGIPAVVAMQFEIADDVASTFAHEFYSALADGYPIDAAVTESRKAIFARGGDVEWGTPVLYLRAPDGRIFDVKRDEAPAVAPQAAGSAGPPGDPPSAAGMLQAAEVALANGNYADALKLLETAATLGAYPSATRDLADRARQQQAVAETRAQRRRAFEERMAAAEQFLARGELQAALGCVRDALRLRPRNPEAIALRTRIRQAIDANARDKAASRRREQPAAAAPTDPVLGRANSVETGRESAVPERGREKNAPDRSPKPSHDEGDLID